MSQNEKPKRSKVGRLLEFSLGLLGSLVGLGVIAFIYILAAADQGFGSGEGLGFNYTLIAVSLGLFILAAFSSMLVFFYPRIAGIFLILTSLGFLFLPWVVVGVIGAGLLIIAGSLGLLRK